MLDSGEADSLRYEKGKWVNNHHAFAFKHYRKGVFRQFKKIMRLDLSLRGLYISINRRPKQRVLNVVMKFAKRKNEDVLYWLSLR